MIGGGRRLARLRKIVAVMRVRLRRIGLRILWRRIALRHALLRLILLQGRCALRVLIGLLRLPLALGPWQLAGRLLIISLRVRGGRRIVPRQAVIDPFACILLTSRLAAGSVLIAV